MSDITANVVVSMPSQLFTMPRSFKAVANGKIYIGQIDTDPVNPANQIQVYIENEDGSHVPVSQPIVINAGGYPVYNGQIAKFVTVQGHSMAVYDAYNAQQFYFHNVLKYDPDQFKLQLSNTTDQQLGDSLVGVRQPLQGSVGRTQHEKNRDIISVKDFGAVGDGATVDTAAIQNALDSGRSIFFPPGVYLCGPVTLTGIDSIAIYSESGIHSAQIKSISSGFILTLNGATNIKIEGLTFTGDDSLSGTGGVNLINNSMAHVYKCYFYRFNGPGLRHGGDSTNQMSGNIIRDCIFYSCGTDGASPQLECIYSQDYSYTGNQFGSLRPFTLENRPAIGVRMTSCSNGYFSDNLIWQCSEGAVFQEQCRYNRIIANRFEESQKSGVSFSDCELTIFSNNWINDNSLLEASAYDAAIFYNCSYFTITGNQVHAWGYPSRVHATSYSIGGTGNGNTFKSNKSRYAGGKHFSMGNSVTATEVDYFVSYTSATNLTGNTVSYLTPVGSSTNQAVCAINSGKKIAASMTLQLNVSPGTNQSVTAVLMVDGVETGLLCSVSNNGFSSYSTVSVDVHDGSAINIKLTYSLSAASSIPRVVVNFVDV
ncbi:phage tailspike protein [Citrobacter sp. Igbk 14]|uniref:phage tailspike protein n=1 Tax=Citrobacter sp. Igbk 14 TaxID=2963960 RepID=UPI00230333BA|nr:phage tailspike protein [Citrobacter sp. Igbk 14]MDA8513480.1 phage tailspike protein [Citrobacter sp. Igbk 14]